MPNLQFNFDLLFTEIELSCPLYGYFRAVNSVSMRNLGKSISQMIKVENVPR